MSRPSRYTIVWSPSARRAIENELPEAVATAVVEFVYSALAENPRRVGKPLHDSLSGMFSARRGTYRVVYTINDDRVVVEIVKVGHRKSVYRPD